MALDWYEEAREEFMQDLHLFNSTTRETAEKIYNFLVAEGLIDYDVEKEYLWDNYVEEE